MSAGASETSTGCGLFRRRRLQLEGADVRAVAAFGVADRPGSRWGGGGRAGRSCSPNELPRSIATLSSSSAWVGVGPPLSLSTGSSPATTPTRSLDSPSSQLPSSSRLKPPEVNSSLPGARPPLQLSAPPSGSATSVPRTVVLNDGMEVGPRARPAEVAELRASVEAVRVAFVGLDPAALGPELSGRSRRVDRVAADRAAADGRFAPARSPPPCAVAAEPSPSASATLPLIVLASIVSGAVATTPPPRALVSPPALPLARATFSVTTVSRSVNGPSL